MPHFGPEAFQLPSGKSVIIANPVTKKVYKYCLNNADALRLYHYLLGRLKPKRSVFPESVKNVLGVAKEDNPIPFFEFPLLRPPLSPELAHQYAIPFVGSVHEAITELHDQFKIAHLDIMLGNICIAGDGLAAGTLVAKLIDLDRSQNAGKPFLKSNVSKYTSVMYKGKKDWTLGQLDWRKLGIVIFGFLNNTPSHVREPEPNSGFLKGLVDNGVFKQDLFLQWDPKVDIID